MLRNKLFILAPALLCVSLFGCKKEPEVVTPTTKFEFNLTGVKNTLNMETIATDSMEVSIERKVGSSEKISLSVDNLPANVTATISNNNSLPPFKSKIIIRANNAAAGNYLAVLNATGATAGTVGYPIALNLVKISTECVPALYGRYSASDECQPQSSPTPYNVEIVADPSNPKYVTIKNFAGVGVDVKAEVVCGANGIIVPQQKVGKYTFSATGSFTTDRMTVSFRLEYEDGSGSTKFTYTQNCTAKYIKF